MNIKEILNAIEEGKHFIEFQFDSETHNFIVGAIKEKGNPSGLGRHEFAIKEKDDQVIFLNKIAEKI